MKDIETIQQRIETQARVLGDRDAASFVNSFPGFDGYFSIYSESAGTSVTIDWSRMKYNEGPLIVAARRFFYRERLQKMTTEFMDAVQRVHELEASLSNWQHQD